MPNWCNNIVTFRHEDPTQITKIVDAINGAGLFQTFVPIEGEIDREKAIANWGTKWDVATEDVTVNPLDEHGINLVFNTAWSPPLEFYREMVNLGFDVDAYYFEPGMAYIGQWLNGADDYYNDIDPDTVPPHLVEIFGLEEMCEYE